MGHLQIFTGNRDSMLRECLGGGSRIIIISRDEQILKTHGVDDKDVYHVRPLYDEDAYELLCKNAFKGTEINTKDYEELMHDVLSYAGGHPLAIRVLGLSLSGRNVSHWKSALAKLREYKSKDIINVLRIGFDELDDTNKEIFLDIACFFNLYEVQHITEILNFRRFYPECGLQDLIDKSLITIYSGKIHMHRLLVDLGKHIVQEKSPKEPRNWSRIWKHEDLQEIMSNNMAAENLEAIVLEMNAGRHPKTTIRADAFSKMNHLKLLVINGMDFSGSLDYLSNELGSLDYLSNELGYLRWFKYPFESLPPSFQPIKLIELCLTGSYIKQLWTNTKPLYNLKRLDLSYSRNLIKIGDLGEALNLQWLNLQECTKISKIHPSIGLLEKLKFVDLEVCTGLIELPRFEETVNLEGLNLKGCIKLEQIHPSICRLRKLTLLSLQDCTSLIELPHFGEDLNLETLNLRGCIELRKINPSICGLKKLTYLNLEDCKSLVLPNIILGLNSLEYLNLSGCSKLFNILLLGEPRDGEAPIHSHSTLSIIKWPLNSTFSCVCKLDLSFCNLVKIPDAIGNLHCLERLYLMGNNFAALPSFKDLSKLYYLNLQHCKQLTYLPQLPSLLPGFPSENNTLRWLDRELVFGFGKPCIIPLLSDLRKEAGLNIFNCPKIVERESWTSMAIEWMKQINRLDPPLFTICMFYLSMDTEVSWIIPGSEIPSWFDNQHVGMDSLSSLVMPDYECTGICCCVVFGAQYGRGTVSAMRPLKTKGRSGTTIPVVLDEDPVMDISDHMWLVYVDTATFCQEWCSSLQDEIIEGFDIKVKKFGYRLVYDEEDLELSNLSRMDSGKSSAWKDKFLAIEENK